MWHFYPVPRSESPVQGLGSKGLRVRFGSLILQRLSNGSLTLSLKKRWSVNPLSNELIGQGSRIYEVTLCLPSKSADSERGRCLRGHEHFNDVPHAGMAMLWTDSQEAAAEGRRCSPPLCSSRCLVLFVKLVLELSCGMARLSNVSAQE